MKLVTQILLIGLILMLSACTGSQPTATPAGVGMPNPASQYCVEQGGRVEIRDEAEGQAGYCIFESGAECEEWAFYRGECAPDGSQIANPAATYCLEQGHEYEIRTEADGSQIGYCIFDNGRECEEWAFVHGDCGPDSAP